jgi:radical SAM protein with 4Fe4S-binding SPASM domain
MSFETFKLAVEQCRNYAQEVNFSFFGEPTLHPEYERFFRYLKAHKGELGVVLNTNLSLMTEKVGRLWIDTGVNNCRFSIDATTPDTYDLVRPGGPIKNLAGEFVKDRRRLETVNSKVRWWFHLGDHVPTRHVFVVCEKNKSEVVEYVKKWQYWLGEKDEILIKNVLTYGGVIHKDTPEFQEFTFTNPCNIWGQSSLTIDWQGNVTPCNLDVNMGLTIGNIKDSTIKDLYRGKEWNRIRELSQKRKITPCKTCHDANNWTNNIIIKERHESLSKVVEGLKNFRGNRPKYIPRIPVGG